MKPISLVLTLAMFSAVFCRYHNKKDKPVLKYKDIELQFQPEHVEAENEMKPGHRARFVGTNFALSRNIPHGEREIRVFHDGVIAMETVIRSAGEFALFYREVTDGKKVIKLVYKDGNTLADCDISRDRADIDKFTAKFLHQDPADVVSRRKHHSIDVGTIIADDGLLSGRNTSIQLLEDRVLQQPYSSMVDTATLKADCIGLHHVLRQAMREKGVLREANAAQHTRNKRSAAAAAPSRSKRSMLVYPGTNWCGRGDKALTYEDLGEDANTDRCCRDHDYCPHYIEGFDTKYNLFNYRFHTISHCYCDESFRTCLKSAQTTGSEVATMMGNVYFKVIGLACFEFVPHEVCVKRSWWGRCLKYERQMQAEVMGTLEWN